MESTEFYPFGRPRHEERIGFDSAYKYTGKELDKESGLMYFEARYLDSVTGRFVSVDPLAQAPPKTALLNPQFIHAYAYASNNPVMYVDPDGEQLTEQYNKVYESKKGRGYVSIEDDSDEPAEIRELSGSRGLKKSIIHRIRRWWANRPTFKQRVKEKIDRKTRPIKKGIETVEGVRHAYRVWRHKEPPEDFSQLRHIREYATEFGSDYARNTEVGKQVEDTVETFAEAIPGLDTGVKLYKGATKLKEVFYDELPEEQTELINMNVLIDENEGASP